MKRHARHATAIEIGILSAMVNRRVKHDLDKRLNATGIGVGGLSCVILRLLSHQEQTISELSDTMKLNPATLVPVVDALERKGLVKRGQDPADRRRTPLSVTERGADLVSRVPLVAAHDTLVKSLQAMGEAKSQQLLLLRVLAKHMLDDASVARRVSAMVRAFHQNSKGA